MRAVLLSSAVMLCVGVVSAQDRAIAVLLKGTYTTTSELFPSPNAQDPLERSSSIVLDGIPGGGVEVRYMLPDLNLAVGLSAEYLAATAPRRFTGIPLCSRGGRIPRFSRGAHRVLYSPLFRALSRRPHGWRRRRLFRPPDPAHRRRGKRFRSRSRPDSASTSWQE